MDCFGFALYLVFISSWFLHLTARFPILGVIRFDLVLVFMITVVFLVFTDKHRINGFANPCYKRMLLFIFVILAITPFAEWPGSAIKYGLPNFIKAIVFFFFTVWFVQTESRLKVFITVFLVCQSFRVLEPLYLHLTEGYWGSKASMYGWQFMNRLSGGPHDVINPNGLAFVILSILPFLLYLFRENLPWKIFAISVTPPSLYALYLTGSRSGMLGLAVVLSVFVLQSKRKVAMLIPIVVLSLFAMDHMEGNFKDRYESIFSADTANAATAQGRIDAIWNDLKVGLRKPIIGHGLGTSEEANGNFGSHGKISHNLYTETFQEIGIVGLGLFLTLIYQIFKNLLGAAGSARFMKNLRAGLIVFCSMNLFFGLASYGLSSYEWYFLAALSLITFENDKKNNIIKDNAKTDKRFREKSAFDLGQPVDSLQQGRQRPIV
jgi:O-antigen ligase